MSSRRRFQPSLDVLQARIAPSTTTPTVDSSTTSTASVSTIDDTGIPTTPADGEGSYPILFVPPGSAPPSTSTIC